MRNSKKLVVLSLALVMSVANLGGCGSSEETQTTAAADSDSSSVGASATDDKTLVVELERGIL